MLEVIDTAEERIQEINGLSEPSEASFVILDRELTCDSDVYVRCAAAKRLFDIFGDECASALSAILLREYLEPKELRDLALSLFESDNLLLASELEVLASGFSPVSYTHLTLPTICSV